MLIAAYPTICYVIALYLCHEMNILLLVTSLHFLLGIRSFSLCLLRHFSVYYFIILCFYIAWSQRLWGPPLCRAVGFASILTRPGSFGLAPEGREQLVKLDSAAPASVLLPLRWSDSLLLPRTRSSFSPLTYTNSTVPATTNFVNYALFLVLCLTRSHHHHCYSSTHVVTSRLDYCSPFMPACQRCI